MRPTLISSDELWALIIDGAASAKPPAVAELAMKSRRFREGLFSEDEVSGLFWLILGYL